MLNAVESGRKAAMMVPTEILALQHYSRLMPYCEELKIPIYLIISKMRASIKKKILSDLESEKPIIVIGTHALFQETVQFKNLGIVIIDEQHKFGVNQRKALITKEEKVDFLLMSATPIPRSLAMLNYADMDLSIIHHKPSNRLPVDTLIISTDRIMEVKQSVARVIAKGEKVFWLCPLIEESEKIALSNVESRLADLEKDFHGKVGIVHGRMPPDIREEVMQDFIDGKFKLLIATTVIEVGVDVPEATVMVIENPERFGLSQLHQLRGRIGRSDKKSYCILLYKKNIGADSMKRLKVIQSSNDGFKIAQEDMYMRGSGDVAGVKQSGLPAFKNFDIYLHREFIPIANKQASDIVDNNKIKDTAVEILLRLL